MKMEQTKWNWNKIANVFLVVIIILLAGFSTLCLFLANQQQELRVYEHNLTNATREYKTAYALYLEEKNKVCEPEIKIEYKEKIVEVNVSEECNYIPYIKTIQRLENERVNILLLNDSQYCDNISTNFDRCIDDLEDCEIKINDTLELLE